MQIGATLLWFSHKIYNYIKPAMIIQLVPYVHTNASPIPTSFFLSIPSKVGEKKRDEEGVRSRTNATAMAVDIADAIAIHASHLSGLDFAVPGLRKQ